jgi:hypothetical protein
MRFSKHLLCTLVVAGLVGVLAIPAGAAPTPVSKARAAVLKPTPVSAIDQVFDLRGLPADKRDITKAAIENHDFDWTKLLPRLRKDGARKRITITVTDTSSWGAVGLAWPAPIGKIEIDDDVRNPFWFRDVVLHELGHMVDFYYLDPNGLQKDVAAIYGRSWEVAGHPFNAAFTQAFSTYRAVDGDLPLADDKVVELRALLGGQGGLPKKSASLGRVRVADDSHFPAAGVIHDHELPQREKRP